MAISSLFNLVFLFVVGWSAVVTLTSELSSDDLDALQILNILRKSRAPTEFHEVYDAETGTTRLLSFEWSDCGGSNDVAHLKSLTVSPDPLRLPGNITVGFTWEAKDDVIGNISMDIKLEKKISFLWITVPCDKIPGGCHYDNICDLLGKETCPIGYKNCHCPFKKGTYTLTPTAISVKQGGIPGGDYKFTAWLKQGSKEVGCIYLQLSVA